MTDSATVTVQARRPGETTWIDVEEYDSSGINTGVLVGAWDIRAGVNTGDLSVVTALKEVEEHVNNVSVSSEVVTIVLDTSGGSDAIYLLDETDWTKQYRLEVVVTEEFDGDTTTEFEIGDDSTSDEYLTAFEAGTGTLGDKAYTPWIAGGSPISIDWTNTDSASEGELTVNILIMG